MDVLTYRFYGHVIPGSFFLLFASWWLIWILKTCRKERGHGFPENIPLRSWYICSFCTTSSGSTIPLEPILKVITAGIGIPIELNSANFRLLDENGEFKSMNDFSHVTMYSFFGLSAIVEIVNYYNIIRLPKNVEHVFLALAFLVEGALFYFHLDGRPKVNTLVHTFLYLAAFATAAVVLVEPLKCFQPWPSIAKVYLTLLQGTWFYQVAHILYGKDPWDEKSHGNIHMVAIIFAWHSLGILLVLLTLFGLVQRCCVQERENYEDIAMNSRLLPRETGCETCDNEVIRDLNCRDNV